MTIKIVKSDNNILTALKVMGKSFLANFCLPVFWKIHIYVSINLFELQRPRNYPTAKYTCKLCDVLIESIAFAHKHIKEKRHKKNIKVTLM